MRRDFFPDRETDMLNWTANFARLLGEQYASLGVSAETVAAYADVVADFADAFQAANDPARRTPIAIARKNDCKRAAEAMSRGLARQIGANMQVSDDQRQALGLNIRKRATRKIEAPEHGPTVAVLRVTGATVDVMLDDPQGPTRRARPDNAAAAAIFVCVSPTRPPTGPGTEDAWRYLMTVPRTSATIDFGAKYPPGTRVWLMARWISRRGEASADGIATYACLGEGSPNMAHFGRRLTLAA